MSKNPFEGVHIQLKKSRKRRSNGSYAPGMLTGAFYAKHVRVNDARDVADSSLVRAHLNGDMLELIRRNKLAELNTKKPHDSIMQLPKHIFATPSTSLFEQLKLPGKVTRRPQEPVAVRRELSYIANSSRNETLPDLQGTIDFCPRVASTPMPKIPITSLKEKHLKMLQGFEEGLKSAREKLFPGVSIAEEIKKDLKTLMKIKNDETCSIFDESILDLAEKTFPPIEEELERQANDLNDTSWLVDQTFYENAEDFFTRPFTL